MTRVEMQREVDKILTKINEDGILMTQGAITRKLRSKGIKTTIETVRKYIKSSKVPYKNMSLSKGEMRPNILAKSDDVLFLHNEGFTLNSITQMIGISRQSVIKLIERAGCKID